MGGVRVLLVFIADLQLSRTVVDRVASDERGSLCLHSPCLLLVPEVLSGLRLLACLSLLEDPVGLGSLGAPEGPEAQETPETPEESQQRVKAAQVAFQTFANSRSSAFSKCVGFGGQNKMSMA